jgi:hypothetical protein
MPDGRAGKHLSVLRPVMKAAYGSAEAAGVSPAGRKGFELEMGGSGCEAVS